MRTQLIVEAAATRLEGPLLFLKRTVEAALNEAVEVIGADGRKRLGRVATIDEQHMVIEVLESTTGLALAQTRVRFFGEPLHFAVGPGILGRVFNGVGQAIDGGPPIAAVRRLRIEGLPMNPVERDTPRDFIETGISTIDLMNSLVRGQKLPLFSGGGLPHDRMAAQIAINAHLRRAGTHESRERQNAENTPGEQAEQFVIVFAGIGLPYESADYFRRTLEESGALTRTALFLNLASDSSTQRSFSAMAIYAMRAARIVPRPPIPAAMTNERRSKALSSVVWLTRSRGFPTRRFRLENMPITDASNASVAAGRAAQ